MIRLLPLLVTTIAALTACSSEPNGAEASRRQAEVDRLRAEAGVARSEADRLVAEVKLLRNENTRLKDEVERLSLELGELRTRPPEEVTRIVEIPIPQEDKSSPPSSAGQRVSNGRGLEVVRATARSGETNSSWWRYGWTVVIENVSDLPQVTDLDVRFMDRDGYVLDADREHGVQVAPHSTRTITGETLINAHVAPRVASVRPVFRK